MKRIYILFFCCSFFMILFIQEANSQTEKEKPCYDHLLREGRRYFREGKEFAEAYNRFYAAKNCKELDNDSLRIMKLNKLDDWIQKTYKASDDRLKKTLDSLQSSKDSILNLKGKAEALIIRLENVNIDLDRREKKAVRETAFSTAIANALKSQKALRKKEVDCALSLAYAGYKNIERYNKKNVEDTISPIPMPAIVFEAFGNAVFEKYQHKNITGHQEIMEFRITQNEHRLLTIGRDSIVKLWNMRPFSADSISRMDSVVTMLSDNHIISATLSATGTKMILGNKEATSYIWREGDTNLISLDHKDVVAGAFLKREKILTISRDGSIKMWSEKGSLITLEQDGDLKTSILDILISEKYNKAFFRSASKVFVLDLDNLNHRPEILTHGERYIYGMSLSPEETHLSTIGHDGKAKVWLVNGALSSPVHTVNNTGAPVYTVAFNPKVGKDRIMTGARNGLVQFASYKKSINNNTSFGKAIKKHKESVKKVLFSSDGNHAVSVAGNMVHLYSETEDKIIYADKDGFISSVAFSPDSQLFATGSTSFDKGKLELWKINGDLFVEQYFESPIIKVQFLDKGAQIIVVTKKGAVTIFPNPQYILQALNAHKINLNLEKCEEDDGKNS